MKLNRPITARAIAALFSLLALSPARAVLNETPGQYQQRYGKATHELSFDSSHPGFGYMRKPYGIIAVFEKDRSIGEMIIKAGGMSAVDIANLLRQNGAGLPWRKENIPMSKSDAEKMRAQGVLDLQMWSRTDQKTFATYLKGWTGTGKSRQQVETLLIGNKKAVKLLTDMSQSGRQLNPKPVK